MALTIDQTPTLVETIVASSVTTGTFTTTVATEIIIAMCTSDGFFSTGGTFTITDNGGGLGWTLIKRSNAQATDGTCEAWYALVTSIKTNLTVTATYSSGTTNRLNLQVVTLSGHDVVKPIGATLGTVISAAVVSGNITTTVNNSQVFALFSNSDGAIDNTSTVVGSNQTKISQGTFSATHGEGTFWRQTNTTTPVGVVTSNLTTPATDTGDLVVFEIVPPNLYAAWTNTTISEPYLIPSTKEAQVFSPYPFPVPKPNPVVNYFGGPAPQPMSINIAI